MGKGITAARAREGLVSGAGGVRAIELWTDEAGPGRFLYEKHGFCQVDRKGLGFEEADHRSNQIRMRLDLS